MARYYHFIKKITGLGLILWMAFGIQSFLTAIPGQIYITRGNAIDYNFGVPVKVVLKEESMEAFENYAPNIQETGLPEYTVTCKLFGIFPVKDVDVMLVEEDYVYASGEPIGIYARTDGVLIIGTGIVEDCEGSEVKPTENLLKSGDYIVSINGDMVSKKEELTEKINQYGSEKEVLGIRRDNEYLEVAVNPVKNIRGNYMIGVWVRDDLAGVGTMTYYEKNGDFGALGHAISDGDTGMPLEMSEGWIYNTQIIGIQKAKGGTPGELSGIINYSENNCLGRILENTSIGIYGRLDKGMGTQVNNQMYEVAYKQDIQRGKAYIVSSLSGQSAFYEIEIESVDYSGNEENKGILFRVTDEKLLDKTGGIVQGMSGSPIIQNGKIIGAVTHVFVQDSTRGYGIFIENML